MKEFINYLELLKERLENLKATQDVELLDLAPGQLHRWAEFEELPELFYLITEINDDYCDVIPGSLDAVMAGTGDIILPKDVLGDFVFLSLDMAATLPRKALGKGFAILDDATYDRVIDSQIEFETGSKGATPSFPFAALGFAGREDSRRIYHQKMSEIIQNWQKGIRV